MMIKYIFAGFIFFSVINLSVLQIFLLFPSLLPPPQSNEFIKTGFYFHSREESNINKDYSVSAYDLTSLKASTFDANKKTIFIVHGFSHNGRRSWLKQMAEALLKFGDYNVLRVDWGRGSLTVPIDQALANTKTVGEEIANFVNTLKREFNFDTAKGHCISHSMGAHVCGHAGQRIDKLGRITALDPGPIQIAEVRKEDKLDPSDADFVDVIHTGLNFFNIVPSLVEQHPVGHVDIYVEGGERQPGCDITLASLLDPNNNLEGSFLDLFVNEVACGHFRAISYYIESILNSSCQWVAYECSSFELFQKGECASCGTDNTKCALLGPRVEEYPAKSRENVKFFVDSAGKPPFCVQHYVVAISTGIIAQSKSPSGGVISFEVIGNNGSFTDEFHIDNSDNGKVVKKLFINHVDVGQISSVKLSWKSDSILLGLIKNQYVLGVYYIEVSPLSHYPESVRVTYDVVACLSTDGSPTPIKDGETETFFVRTSC